MNIPPFNFHGSPVQPSFLKGSKDPNNTVLGHKYYNIKGIWALKRHYLGPWTLRVVEDRKSACNPATPFFYQVPEMLHVWGRV